MTIHQDNLTVLPLKIQNLTVLNCQILAHARLHMGFYDLSVQDGEQSFGSVGLSLQAPQLQLEVGFGEAETSPGLVALMQQFCDEFDVKLPIYAKLQQTIPRHAGLGSGTQMALALAAGLSRITTIDAEKIMRVFNRGARSGIGIGAFAQGGFLVDSGKSKTQPLAAALIIERCDFPPDWRIILVEDDNQIGVHGEAEKSAFNQLPKIKNNLQELVFKGLLPAVKRQDLLAFGAYLQALQAYNGDYFAPVQGGHYASKKVENVLAWLSNNGVVCMGQSSWGPTGFAIVESEAIAQQLKNSAEVEFGISKPLSNGFETDIVKPLSNGFEAKQTAKPLRLTITQARNSGATIKEVM